MIKTLNARNYVEEPDGIKWGAFLGSAQGSAYGILIIYRGSYGVWNPELERHEDDPTLINWDGEKWTTEPGQLVDYAITNMDELGVWAKAQLAAARAGE